MTNSLVYGDMFETDRYVRLRFDIYKSLLSPYIKKGTRLCDIGCYCADILKILPSGVDYYGIDSDHEALEIAKRRGAKVERIDLENDQIPFREPFDIVIVAELLEHLKDPEKIVLQVKNLLKENGVLLVSLPNECTLYHRFKVLCGRGIDGTAFAPHYHLHFPTIKQGEEFIAGHFKIVEKRYWFHLGVGKVTEKLLSIIPDRIWMGLASLLPALFARGSIYLCKK